MSDITSIDVPSVGRVSDGFAQTTQALGTALGTLTQVLNDHVGCWGDDKTGKQFADQYFPQSKQFVQQAKQFQKSLETNVDSFAQVPAQYERVDQNNGF